MSAPDAEDAIDNGERLFRRIPLSMGWYDEISREVSPEAFQPRRDDTTGLSIYREKFIVLENVAHGPSKRGYYVAVLTAGQLRANGITVQQDDPHNPAHAILPELRIDNRESNEALELMQKLSRLVIEVAGPFLPG
jgi:hypothetical protein